MYENNYNLNNWDLGPLQNAIQILCKLSKHDVTNELMMTSLGVFKGRIFQ